MEDLSATAKAILGIVAMRPRTGYEIKAFVDNSTRFFWAASYGQIYPELKRLSENGLIEGTDEPTGGRQRTVYKITAAGKKRLREWHREPSAELEYRDEGMLKLFLAGAVEPGSAPPHRPRPRGAGARDRRPACARSRPAPKARTSPPTRSSPRASPFTTSWRTTSNEAALALERGLED